MRTITISEFQQLQQQGNMLIADVRPQEAILDGFISQAILLPANSGMVIPPTIINELVEQVCFIGDPSDAEQVWMAIDKAEQDPLLLDVDQEAWMLTDPKMDLVILVDADEVAMDLPFDDRLVLIDVRSLADFELQQVESAIHIPLLQLADLVQIANLPLEANLYFYGSSTAEGLLAASLVKRHELHNVRVVAGGFSALQNQAGIPLKSTKAN